MKTYNDGLRAAASIAAGYKGSAAKERRKSSMTRHNIHPEAWESIRSEERGEDIAAERIAALILAAQEPYENPNR